MKEICDKIGVHIWNEIHSVEIGGISLFLMNFIHSKIERSVRNEVRSKIHDEIELHLRKNFV